MAEPTTQTTQPGEGKIIGASPKAFRGRIERTKVKRRALIRQMQANADMRRAKAVDTDSDDDRTPFSFDWAMTNAKVAQLFSQVPKVIATGEGPYKQAAPVYEKRLNMLLDKAGVGAVMNECFPDAINAAGIGIALVSYQAREEMREVPAIPDAELGMVESFLISKGLKKREMISQPFITDRKFSVDRKSPADFLWPVEFTRSNFDLSPWIGFSGRMTWAEAQTNLGLKDDVKEKVLGDVRTAQDKLVIEDSEGDVSSQEEDVVSFDEIYYWRYLYHPEEKYFKAIQRLVFVEGIEEPVVNEPWKGQEFDEEIGSYIGSCLFPLRVLSLHYLSDEAIPPSDSAVGRPMVNALLRSLKQVEDQRDHSKPINWYDVNRIDADIQTLLMQGDWQGFIPTQGDGERALGQVARSNYPKENYDFDRIFRSYLMESWATGPNQGGTMAASGEHSATEVKEVGASFNVRIGMERALGVAFFLGIADVMAGLMSLYDDFELPDQKDQERLQMWDRKRVRHELAFSIRGDSTVLLSSDQRIERIMRFLNIAGKSGYVAPQPLLEELAALSGLDPATVVQPPPKKGPDPANVSFRFSGAEDLNHPMAVAILMRSDLAPTKEELAAALELLRSAGTVAKVRMSAEKDEVEVSAHVEGEQPAPGGVPPPVGGPQPAMSDDRPELQSVDRINSRRDASQE